MAAACASFARPHSTTANNPDAWPSTGSARQRLFPRQILIAAAIACARPDSTFHQTHMNASFKARIRSPLLHMMGSIIHSRLFRTALLILGSLILGSLIH